MSTPPVAAPGKRSPCLVVGLAGGCLLLCLCAALAGAGWFYLAGPGQTAPIMTNLFGTPTPHGSSFGNLRGTAVPVQPGVTRAPSGTRGGTQTFSGQAPYTLQYPLDWDVNDDEADNQFVLFVAPDEDAYAAVMYQPATSASAEALLTSMVNDLPGNEGSVKVISKKTNPDGSVFEELTYEDSDLGGTTHGYARVIKTRDNTYLVIFGSRDEQFAKYRDAGTAIVNSFNAK